MPNYNGDLTDKDTLRLLDVLRYVRRAMTEEEQHLVVAEPDIGGVKIQITKADFLDKVLSEYREYQT